MFAACMLTFLAAVRASSSDLAPVQTCEPTWGITSSRIPKGITGDAAYHFTRRENERSSLWFTNPHDDSGKTL